MNSRRYNVTKIILIISLGLAFAAIIYALYTLEVRADGALDYHVRDGVNTAEWDVEKEISYELIVLTPRYSLSPYDEELLCRIAYSEAGNQGIYGQALVMSVVMNRVESSRFPNSVEEVIYQPSQFSLSHWFYEAPVDNMRLALELLQNGEVESYGALFFCTTSFRSGTYLFSYGGHNFYM